MYLCCLLLLRDILYPTVMVRCSLFVLKVPLNPKQTKKQTLHNLVVVVAAANTCVCACVQTYGIRYYNSSDADL